MDELQKIAMGQAVKGGFKAMSALGNRLGKFVPRAKNVAPPLPSAAQRATRSMADPKFKQMAEQAAGGAVTPKQMAIMSHRAGGSVTGNLQRYAKANPKVSVGQGMQQSFQQMTPEARSGMATFNRQLRLKNIAGGARQAV